jgi:hypothetical protein
MTYYGITHRLTPHKVTNIATKHIYDDDASNGASVTMDKIMNDSQGLKKRSFLRSFIVVKNRPI